MSEPENILDDWSDHVTVDNDTWETLMLQHEEAAAEARAALLTEVLQAVNDLSLRTKRKQTNMYATDQQRDYYGAKIEAFNEVRTRLAALNQTENDDEAQKS